MPIPSTETASGRNTFDIPVRSATDAAQKLARIHSVNSLLSDARTQVPDVVLPSSGFVADPDSFSNLGEDGYRTGGPGAVPNPGQGTRPDPDSSTHPQPGVTTQDQPSVPAPARHPQPGVTTQHQPQPPTDQTVDGNPLYAPPLPIPGAKPDSQPVMPSTSLLDMPDTTGLGEGATWNGTMLDGRPVTYTIPEGNGNNTVDLEITNKNGTKDHWRIARNALGGLQHWHDDADGNSSYAYRATAESHWNFQRFDPGVSTSGAPSGELGATPDLHTIFTPSFDSDGNPVGIDIAKMNRFGKYDNYHVDNYGNLTITSYKPDGKGGFESVFVNQFDRNSWRFGEDGEVWEIGKDLQGRPTAGRSYDTDQGRHVLFIDHLNELYDSFYGSGKNSTSYTDHVILDGKTIRSYRNGPKVTFDDHFRVQSVQYPTDHRDFLQRSRDAVVSTWDNALDASGNWFAETSGINELSRAYNSSSIGAPYQSPSDLEMWAKFGGGVAELGRSVAETFAYPYLTVAEWGGRRILATAYNLRAGFDHSEGGRASAQTAQKIIAGSPSNTEAALSAGMLLLPYVGQAARGIGLGIKIGGRALTNGISVAAPNIIAASKSFARMSNGLTDIVGRPLATGSKYLTSWVAEISLDVRSGAASVRDFALNGASRLGVPGNPLLSPGKYLEQQHVREALKLANRSDDLVTLGFKKLRIGEAVDQLLPLYSKLARIMQQNQALEASLLNNPKTIVALLQQPKSIGMVDDVLRGRYPKPKESVGANEDIATSSRLTESQRAISTRAQHATPKYLENKNPRQPGLDKGRLARDPTYGKKFLDDMYAKWEESQAHLNKLVNDIEKSVGGKSGARSVPKGRDRAEAKIRTAYGGDPSKLVDLTGAKLTFEKVDQIYRALDEISNSPIKILRIKDRFIDPADSGYRDILMNVQTPNGLVGELRLHLASIDKSAAKFEHAIYEVRRDIEMLAEDSGRPMTSAEKAIYDGLARRSTTVFWDDLMEGLPKK